MSFLRKQESREPRDLIPICTGMTTYGHFRVKNRLITKNQKQEAKTKGKDGFWLWRSLSSVKLAVVLIFLIAMACILGTFIIQGRSVNEYIAKYGKGLTAFFEFTQLTNVFHSYWFTVLLLLLCVNLAVCAIKRWRNTILQLGFVATHSSIILIMIGSLIDVWFGAKGGINLEEGQSVDYYYTFNNMERKPLGFELMLEDFELEKHPPKFELISYLKETDKERRISTEIGYEQAIQGSPYKIKILKFIPDAELRRNPINTSKEPKNPAVFVQLFGSEEVKAEGWLIANDRNWYEFKKAGIRLEYYWAETNDIFEALISSDIQEKKKENDTEPRIGVILKDKNITEDFPININEDFSIENTGYSIKITEYTLDFTNRDLPINEQSPNNPALKINIQGPQGLETRWVFAKYPEWDEMHGTKYADLKLIFKMPDEILVKHLIKIVQRPEENNNRYIYTNEGKVVENAYWELNRKYEIGNTGHQLRLLKFYPSFAIKEEVVQRSEELKNPALFIETSGPLGTASEWLFARDARPWWYEDGNFALLYQEQQEMIKDFKSTLKIIDGGKTALTKTIEVNDPLSYKGFDFYQANYDPNNPRFSGIQITSHPGIPVVYAGFGVLCFGVVFIFYIKPLIKRYRKNKGKEGG